MKLVIATPLYPPAIGGPAAYAKHLHDEFRARGIAVRVVAYSALERLLPTGVRHFAYFLRLLPRAARADAVLALDTWSVGIPALLAARLSRARFAVRIGGDFLWESFVARTGELVRLGDFYRASRALSAKEKLIRAGTRYLLSRADRIIFNTEWQRTLWEHAYGFPPEKARVVENFVPSAREDAPAKGLVFVSAGRGHVLKNHALLARVFARIREDYPDISLDTRPLPPEAHEARIRDAYAVVIPSVSEVNPNTAIDAIRYGKPFIAPEDSGASPALRKAGVFLDTRNEAALEKALRALLAPEAYALAKARARAYAVSRSWETVAREMRAAIFS